MVKKDEHLFDTRLYRRNVRKGLITQKDYEAHIKGLPDDEPNSELVKLDIDDTEVSESSTVEDKPEA